MVSIVDSLVPGKDQRWKAVVKKALPRRAHSYFRSFYYRLLKFHLRDTESVVLSFDGIEITFDTTNDLVFDWLLPQHIDGSLHEPPVSRLIFESLRADSVFFDVGSHVGYFTAFAGQLCPDGEVHAFEIDPACVEAIEQTVAINSTLCPVTVNNQAVSDRTGATVSFVPHARGNRSTNQVTDCVAESEVDTISLDNYCERRDIIPDVVKIDAEGSEFNILHGFEATIQAHKPTLFVALHPKLLAARDQSPKSILRWLQEFGYNYRILTDQRDPSSEPHMETADSITDLCMLICYSSESEPWT